MTMDTKRPARMTLELPAKARGKLERLGDETDQSLAEVIRRSLALYDLLYSEVKKGGTLIIRSPEGVDREVLITEFRE